MTNAYLIEKVDVKGVWGQKEFSISFCKDVNILIGKNGSGKTTLLDLIRLVLTVDVYGLKDIQFDRLDLYLRDYDHPSKKKISVVQEENEFIFKVSKKSYKIEIPTNDYRTLPRRFRQTTFQRQAGELVDILSNLVPAAWLPVSRRLPIADDFDEEGRYSATVPRKRNKQMESVDVRLHTLLEELIKYRLMLDKKISILYKEFERSVLQLTLYSPNIDKIGEFTVPTDEEKEQLISAFDEAGLLDRQMANRIDQHFQSLRESMARLEENRRDTTKTALISDYFNIPMINIIKDMVKFAGELERERDDLFKPLKKYEKIVSSFFETKSIKVADSGVANISFVGTAGANISPFMLSSGEKQILILLTEALLWENNPVVYVADEPELSLHVTWQAKLLKALKDLGGKIQIIVATHSPDIVDEFMDNVINLDEDKK